MTVAIRAAVATMVTVLPGGQVQEPPKFVPAEVLVRFSAESEGRPATTDAVSDVRLDSFLRDLSRQIERPLRLQRAGSGGELLLELDTAALASRLECALRAVPGVANAAAFTAQEEGSRRGPRAAVKARIERSPRTIARQLSHDLGLPVQERALADGSRLFDIDLEALTLDVVERLKHRSDVDYAQPNYTVSYR